MGEGVVRLVDRREPLRDPQVRKVHKVSGGGVMPSGGVVVVWVVGPPGGAWAVRTALCTQGVEIQCHACR